MSKTKYGYGWTDPRMPRLDAYAYVYEVRYSASPHRHQVVKRSLVHQYVVKVIASGLTREAAEGYIKLLKED
jgi:hypothetical protein